VNTQSITPRRKQLTSRRFYDLFGKALLETDGSNPFASNVSHLEERSLTTLNALRRLEGNVFLGKGLERFVKGEFEVSG
jgi:hypothetical protein